MNFIEIREKLQKLELTGETMTQQRHVTNACIKSLAYRGVAFHSNHLSIQVV